MTQVRLYSQQMNPFSEKVACALAVKGVEFLRVEVSDPDEIKKLSPEQQLLPVLEIDGKRVGESSVIIRWIDDLYPQPSLYASDPKTRSQQESLAAWSDTSFAFYWNRWRALRQEYERQRVTSQPGLLMRIHQHVGGKIGIESDAGSALAPGEAELMQQVAQRMDDLVGFLGSRDYFYSDQPSVADLAVYGMLLVMRSGPMPGSAELLSARPTLGAHLQRMIKISHAQGSGTSVQPEV